MSSMNEKTKGFLKDLGIGGEDVSIVQVCENILSEMEAGLAGKSSSLEMIPTFIDVPEGIPPRDPVTVIDAGGTNFRVGTARFSESGEFVLESLHKTVMPGTERHLTKDEFFTAMADMVREPAAESDRIGFCFSYPTVIYPDKDGRLIRFVKEVKAPEVEGELIGRNLLKALGADKKIAILNDTVATLLAGKAAAGKRTYSGYIGFILGTGMNGSYIEAAGNIAKLPEASGRQIINTELGNFNKLQKGKIDMELDENTENPGVNSFEKMFSGGYIGDLVFRTLKKGVDKGFLDSGIGPDLGALRKFSSEDLNDFLMSPEGGNPLADICRKSGIETTEKCYHIAAGLVERAAKLAAAALAALCLKTGRGDLISSPLCITVEGSTFYGLKNLRDLTLCHLKHHLTDERGIHFDIVSVENATIKGAAIAGLT